MLACAIPLVPIGHNCYELIVDGETGYICDGNLHFKQHVRELAQRHETA